jgi:hypothetical protein
MMGSLLFSHDRHRYNDDTHGSLGLTGAVQIYLLIGAYDFGSFGPKVVLLRSGIFAVFVNLRFAPIVIAVFFVARSVFKMSDVMNVLGDRGHESHDGRQTDQDPSSRPRAIVRKRKSIDNRTFPPCFCLRSIRSNTFNQIPPL